MKKILKLDPRYLKVYEYLADLHADRGLTNNAVADYATLGKLASEQGLPQQALAAYRKLLKLDPSRLDIKQRMADLCLHENVTEEAVSLYVDIARSYASQQRFDEARQACQAILRIDPHHASAK